MKAAASPFDACVTFLPVADLDASDAFYGAAIGLPLVLDQGACRIYRAATDAYLGFCLRGATAVGRDDESDAGSRVVLTLVTEDVEGEYARLAALGLAFEQAPGRSAQFGIMHAFLRDPDGYLVEIQRFEDPSWSRPPG